MLIFSEIGKLEIVLGASPESPAKALEQLFPIDYSENTIRVLLNYSWNEGAGSLLKDLLHLIIKVLKINEDPTIEDILVGEADIPLKDYLESKRYNIDISLSSIINKAMYKFELWQYIDEPPMPITSEVKAITLSDFVVFSYAASFPSDIFALSILDEVKLQCDIEDNGQDSKILSFVNAAYGLIEKKLRTKLFEEEVSEHIEARGTNYLMASNYIKEWGETKVYRVFGNQEEEIDLTTAHIQHGVILTEYYYTGSFKVVYKTGYSIEDFPLDLKSAIIDEVVFLYKYRQQSAEIVSSRANGQGQTTSYKVPSDMLTSLARHICQKYSYWGQ